MMDCLCTNRVFLKICNTCQYPPPPTVTFFYKPHNNSVHSTRVSVVSCDTDSLFSKKVVVCGECGK